MRSLREALLREALLRESLLRSVNESDDFEDEKLGITVYGGPEPCLFLNDVNINHRIGSNNVEYLDFLKEGSIIRVSFSNGGMSDTYEYKLERKEINELKKAIIERKRFDSYKYVLTYNSNDNGEITITLAFNNVVCKFTLSPEQNNYLLSWLKKRTR